MHRCRQVCNSIGDDRELFECKGLDEHDAADRRVLRDPELRVEWGNVCNVLQAPYLTEQQLWDMLQRTRQTQLRPYAGRDIVDW